MATKKTNKTGRTKIKDVSVETQELTATEAGKVKGGAGTIQLEKPPVEAAEAEAAIRNWSKHKN